MTVALFGHKDTPFGIKKDLLALLTLLIEERDATVFYVGTHGNFDSTAQTCLKELKIRYPHIRPVTVLAYLPENSSLRPKTEESVFPEEVAAAPRRFALHRRLQWMVSHCDGIVCYASAPVGNAAKFRALAERKGLPLWNLAESPPKFR